MAFKKSRSMSVCLLYGRSRRSYGIDELSCAAHHTPWRSRLFLLLSWPPASYLLPNVPDMPQNQNVLFGLERG
ncbi:hypothetical protein LY78DRAFT_654587 [Colletotrichum sublineola]|nr:hypothetical protein LY78DRAFT_654587 [Colletotrichum sublineola]